jgi:hypothetical protein
MMVAGLVIVSALSACSEAPHCGQNLGDRVPMSALQDTQNMNHLPLSQHLPGMPECCPGIQKITIQTIIVPTFSGKVMY